MIDYLFKHLPFKQKLVLSYLIVVIVPILILGIYAYNQSKHLLQTQAQQSLEAYAGKIASNIEEKLGRYEVIIRFIAFNTRIQQILGNTYDNFSDLSVDYLKDVEPFFSNISAMNEDLQQITVYTATGLPQFGNLIQPLDLAVNSSWYEEASKSGDILWFFDGGELYAVQKIVNAYSSRVLGYLYLKLEHNSILDGSLVMEAENYGIVVADKRNEIVYDREVKGSAVSAFSYANGADRAVPKAGDKYIASTKSIARAGLTLTYYVPIDGMNREIGWILRVALMIALLCLVVVGVAIFFFSTHFVKRLQSLNDKMKKTEKGDFDLSIVSDYRDEVGQLTNQFGKMVRRLDELIKDGYEKEIAKKEAELRALQAQINPHFLYNSLSVMNWKAIRMGADEISYVATRLSKFYRAVLNKGHSTISLKEELENIRTYIELQLMFRKNNFDVDYRIDGSIGEFVVPNFFLQPIVENAIEHGIIQKREGRGCLTITGGLRDGCIEIEIEDNGPGMKEEVVRGILSEKHSGYGLRNVDERIRLFTGQAYGLQIRSSEGAGTEVAVRLPIHKADGRPALLN